MKDLASKVMFVPSLIGTLSTIGGTAIGAPVNRLGFKDCVGILTAGGLQGSTGATVTLTVKVQESSSATGTGATWSDITNEGISAGSFKVSVTLGDDVAGGTTTGTWIPYECAKQYALLSDGNRSQWIRAHATLSGTVGLGPKISFGFLLNKPDDTYYIVDPVVQPSGNVELTKLL